MADEVVVHTVTGEILKYWPSEIETARSNWFKYLANANDRVVAFGRFMIRMDRVDFVEFKEG